MAKLHFTFEGFVEAICWGGLLGLLLHFLILQAGTALTIAASVGN